VVGVRYESTTTHEFQVSFNSEGVVTEYEYTRQQMPARRIGYG